MELRELSLDIAEKVGNRSPLLAEIFEFAASPRQIKILAALPKFSEPPATAEQIAKKLKISEKTVRKDLEELFRKGLAYPKDILKREVWNLAQNIDQIHNTMNCAAHKFYPDPTRLYDLWLKYELKEGYAIWADYIRSHPVTHRILPAWRSVMNNPHLQPWEDWREIFKTKRRLSVRYCPCRKEVRANKRPCDQYEEVCLKFDNWSDYDIESEQGREITLDEAIDIVDKAAKSGAVGEGTLTKNIITMCNCAPTACVLFQSMMRAKIPYRVFFDKSRYRSKYDTEKCTGCGKCLNNCNFDAITMVKLQGSKKMVVQRDPEKCFGCGCCYMICPEEGAITMECVRPDYIPPDTLDLAQPAHGYGYESDDH